MNKILAIWWRRYFSSPEAVCLVVLLLSGFILYSTMGNIVAPILTSIIISYMLATVVRWCDKLRWPRLLTVSLVFSLFLGMLLLVFLWLLPLLWEEMNNLFNAMPDMLVRGQKLLLELQANYPVFISLPKLQQFISNWDTHIASVGKFVWSFSLASLGHVVTVLVYVILVPLLVFFFLKDSKPIGNWLSSFLPKERTILRAIGREINCKIGSYIKGKILEMLIVFFVSDIVFALLGLQYSVLLGALVGVSVLVPYVGVVVVTVPIVVVALLEWGWSSQFLYLMLAYATIITLDANVLVPLLFAEAMDLHPVAIILAVFVFGSLGGFWGVFFAIPLATLINVLVKSWPKI